MLCSVVIFLSGVYVMHCGYLYWGYLCYAMWISLLGVFILCRQLIFIVGIYVMEYDYLYCGYLCHAG